MKPVGPKADFDGRHDGQPESAGSHAPDRWGRALPWGDRRRFALGKLELADRLVRRLYQITDRRGGNVYARSGIAVLSNRGTVSAGIIGLLADRAELAGKTGGGIVDQEDDGLALGAGARGGNPFNQVVDASRDPDV